jgi:hypothetical protein
MARSFWIQCPCCGVDMEVDPQAEKVLHHGPKPGEAKGVERFDAVLKNVKESGARAASQWDKARNELKDKPKKLEAAFGEAVKKAKETPDEKPLRPFDLD